MGTPAALSVQPVNVSGAGADHELVGLWLDGKSAHTQRAYAFEAARFLAFVGKPMRAVTLTDVSAYQKTLQGQPATTTRAMATVKSLLSFGHRVGYLAFNVGAVVRLKASRDALAERIVPEADLHRMLAFETDPRNRVLLRFLYVTGLRVSEVVALTWQNLVPHGDGGLVNVFGKGGRTRVVRVPTAIWTEVQGLRCERAADAPVFLSRQGGRLDVSAVNRVVKRAAIRAGLPASVSPHWLRHAHASHALDRGAPISLVQSTLGHASVATTGRYLHARPGESSGQYLAV